METKKAWLVVIIALIMVFQSNHLNAQNKLDSYPFDSTKIYIIKMNDGGQFIGSVTGKDSIFVHMRIASLAKVQIPWTQIALVDELSSENFKRGVYWFSNPHATRYLFGPSAISLKKGEGYYQNTYLFVNSIQYGLTDNLSIGAGVEILAPLLGESPAFFITPKLTFKLAEKFHAGGGVMFVSVPGSKEKNRDVAGILYGIGTYGTPDHNITGGIGYGFINDELARQPFVTISGLTRFSKRAAFVTENWIVPSDGKTNAIISYGVRFFGEKMAVDLAFFRPTGASDLWFLGIPYASFTFKF